ncbi:MAG: hypothetical protein PHQ30_03470 [Candidatus Izemoplasmatales bacterium]|nr:hypothetical protein [Candidatus Izemoplasmatales bacterium]
MGFKEEEEEEKIKEENILLDIFDTPLPKILEFIQIQMKGNIALDDQAQSAELEEFSKKIDNFRNNKYEKDFFLGILSCIFIFPGLAVGMHFQHTMTLVTLIAVRVFLCIWGKVAYYLIIF